MSAGTVNGGMSMRKHGRCGKNPKSPKLRHKMKMEAERNERKAPPSRCHASTMAELLGR